MGPVITGPTGPMGPMPQALSIGRHTTQGWWLALVPHGTPEERGANASSLATATEAMFHGGNRVLKVLGPRDKPLTELRRIMISWHL